ncbi:SDR family NAD(P)-dependent oxidoreductase [Marinovum sp. 2_MG-2023]|uniref:SDR family NAD(P)-dependent oxidoreductase n=1 Tax=unclassified Marinovum TaxID=2647166 RepID=UPI0026E2D3A2|nr:MULTISPECIES: SDR family NAD(P)-dependent oxidoreductase [unclassified Marinovum]MDO6732117.1 SDR family NAD(P)-dependent oxidoreductase [Marinovum sp. 2_MG-2023]MDO6781432.1 SDR family NAD(P)-dependent oxidoreductase [Marinovum sp. 1_MG-2023]
MSTALVTGAAGFIGYHVCEQLIAKGYDVVGLDSMTDYYDVSLKQARLDRLEGDKFTFVKGAVEDPARLMGLFDTHRFDLVVHLAAQAGVRYSIDNPRAYLESNIAGTFELLEAARAFPPRHMLLASTSSTYGANTVMPYVETARADHQMSFYAATKKAAEAMAHSYAHLYDLPVTMFRFFTVYGPWGRPDMALFKFTKAILEGGSIDVYNNGDMSRDFTYIDDLVEALVRLSDVAPVRGAPPAGDTDSLSPVAPFRVINIGNSAPVKLLDFITAIESATGHTATRNMMPMQAGDVPATWADTALLTNLAGKIPHTDVTEGVANFVAWYRDYYNC